MRKEIEIDGRRYRAIKISDRWAKSYFEYFNEHYGQWRAVVNWNSREKLFEAFTDEKKIHG